MAQVHRMIGDCGRNLEIRKKVQGRAGKEDEDYRKENDDHNEEIKRLLWQS